MGLSIKNEKLERSVRELAARRGLRMTSALQLAVDNELAKDAPPKKDPAKVKAALDALQARIAKLEVINPDVNDREWMYDDNGLPH
jgi:hypothetical protein